MNLPIAETFHSIQGEGYWTGTPMHFIRLAGCNVGVGYKESPAFKIANGASQSGSIPLLPTYAQAKLCTAWDHSSFWCDTDYDKALVLTPEELVDATTEKHICLTGGEPLLHQHSPAFTRLLELAKERKIKVHIETSGTLLWAFLDSPIHNTVWISCSPKQGYLQEMLQIADEIKLLVKEDTSDTALTPFKHMSNVYLQPINEVSSISHASLNRTLELLTLFPNFRLSVQLHKLLGVR